MSQPQINWAVYHSLPPAQAEYQLNHVDQSRVKNILSSLISCLVIATVAVILRFISRRMVKTCIKADDWMIVAALFFALGYCISVFLCILKYGGGRHEILLKSPIKFAQSAIAAEVFYAPAIASVKISTLLLFNRLFPSRRFHLLLWSVGIFVAAYSGIQILTAIFQCRPIQGAWDPTVKAKCIEYNLVFMIMGGMNVLTDLILLCAPLPTIWGLHMEKTMKLQLMGIFCVGGFVCIVSVYRIPKLHGLSLADAPWSDADATIWSIVEVCVAIACACAITYRPLFNWLFGLHVSAAGSGPSGQSSKPSSANISYPKPHGKGWEDIDSNVYKMKGISPVKELVLKEGR